MGITIHFTLYAKFAHLNNIRSSNAFISLTVNIFVRMIKVPKTNYGSTYMHLVSVEII